jgi:hypothetical protein
VLEAHQIHVLATSQDVVPRGRTIHNLMERRLLSSEEILDIEHLIGSDFRRRSFNGPFP